MILVIVIPAYNEEKIIGKVLDGLPKKINGISKIETVVVNDGSQDKTLEEARKRKVVVLNHLINRGLGGALGTGIEYARKVKADLVVTFDADGQHNPLDIEKVVKPIIGRKAEFVIGSRIKGKGMPIDRKLANWIGNFVTFFLFGAFTTDSQSGLRALSQKALTKVKLKMNRMEVSSEFIKEAARNKLKIYEVPIQAIYTDYSKVKGQSTLNSVNILFKLVLHRFSKLA